VTFDEAKSLRDRTLWALPKVHTGSLLAYELSGGEKSPRPWQVAGFLAEPRTGGRVVWELMTWAHRGSGLLRVYREGDSFEVPFAVRLNAPESQALDEASRFFVERIGDGPLVDAVSKDREARAELPSDFGEPGFMLYPLPPPIPPELVPDLLDA
jgi:hypothetical protein